MTEKLDILGCQTRQISNFSAVPKHTDSFDFRHFCFSHFIHFLKLTVERHSVFLVVSTKYKETESCK
jgi:hypothetical protein